MQKLNQKQKAFLGRCRTCGSYMKYTPGLSYLTCSNLCCPGKKLRKKGEVLRQPVIRKLDDKGVEIAQVLFQKQILL